ncbi:MAG: hypothetical protein ABI273_11485, partial [Lacunisphaera sp.]
VKSKIVLRHQPRLKTGALRRLRVGSAIARPAGVGTGHASTPKAVDAWPRRGTGRGYQEEAAAVALLVPHRKRRG